MWVQDLLAYMEENPGSSYTREYAVNEDDVKNVKGKVLHPPLKFADCEVKPCKCLKIAAPPAGSEWWVQ